MYIKIGNTSYDALKSLSFAPETDLAGQSLPINEFVAEIVTGDDIAIGVMAELRDDINNLWARYRVTYAEHHEAGVLKLVARSLICLVEQVEMPAVMYEDEDVFDVLRDIFFGTGVPVTWYSPSFVEHYENATVTGFCPKQTGRERLLWLVFSLGAYARDYFSETLLIEPVGDTTTMIPMDRTFMSPKVTYKDAVTAVRAEYFTFEHVQQDPASTDKWVETDGGLVYVVTTQTSSLANPNAPQAAPENVVAVEGLYLLNSANISGTLTHLSKWYFERREADVDVVNNAWYLPGSRVTCYLDDEHMISGYIERCEFSFGTQARSRLKLKGAETVASGALVVLYVHENTQVGEARYRFPVGYAYTIQNPYIDLTMNGHRIVYRPENVSVAGTMASGSVTRVEPETPALDLNLSDNVLTVISVDEVTEESEGVVSLT